MTSTGWSTYNAIQCLGFCGRSLAVPRGSKIFTVIGWGLTERQIAQLTTVGDNMLNFNNRRHLSFLLHRIIQFEMYQTFSYTGTEAA
jgi:hypothetical protein